MTSTLTDLERKLVDLERELSSVAGGPPAVSAAPSVPPAPMAPAETQAGGARVQDLRNEIADLVRFRDQLESAARELVIEYDRLVDRLRTVDHPSSETSPAVVAPPVVAEPEQAGWGAPLPPSWTAGAEPAPAAAPVPGAMPPPAAPMPPAAPSAFDSMAFQGAVVVDAGPFTDITTLSTFEQGLAQVPGAEDVYVRSFEGDRALIDVRLADPVALVQQLRERLSLPITAREASGDRLVVDVDTADVHGT